VTVTRWNSCNGTARSRIQTDSSIGLEEYLKGPVDDMQAAARTHRALPVYADVGGVLFLKTDGDVLFRDSSKMDAGLNPEKSLQWQTIARLAAVERFPELKDLRADASGVYARLPDCGGRGRVLNDALRCDECFGLGWVLPQPNKVEAG